MSAVRLGFSIVWVADVEATLRFYEQAIGLVRRPVQTFGQVVWGEMETGETTLAFASENETQILFDGNVRLNRQRDDPAAMLLSFIVTDVERVFQNAMAHGAKGINPPKREPWGQTVARLLDPNGMLISVADERPQ